MKPGRVAVVTGATGFIGWHVCEHLHDAGWQVTAFVRPESRQKPLPSGIERIEAPLETAALTRALTGAAVLVHAAGITQARRIDEYQRINVEGTRAAVEAARTQNARLIHISSLTAVGPSPAGRPHTETDAYAPITEYGRSKRDAEALVRGATGLRWTIIRPAAVYGPRDRQFLPLFQMARRGWLPRPGNAGTFSLTLAYVTDVARAVTEVCGSNAVDHATLFIGDAAPVTLEALFKAATQSFGRTYRPIPVPWPLIRLGARLGIAGLSGERLQELASPGFVCSVKSAEQLLGFRAAVALEEGMRATTAWYVAQGWLRNRQG